MTLHHRRLSRLEKSRRGRGVDDIWRRCEAGTATLEEMAVVLEDEPERFLREELLPLAKNAIDEVRAGNWFYGVLRVLTYPPGEALPDQERLHLQWRRHLATYTQEDVRTKFYGNPTDHWLNPIRRLEAAVVVLAFGDDGERARSAVWERKGAAWVPSPAVLAAARQPKQNRSPAKATSAYSSGQNRSNSVVGDRDANP